jgi:hypothetical protein
MGDMVMRKLEATCNSEGWEKLVPKLIGLPI